MQSVLISIRPQWCERIASGEKTIEVRKTRPKLETPFKAYIYCTAPKKFYMISEHMATSMEYLHLCDGKVTMSDGFEFCGRADYKVLNRKVIGEFVCDHVTNLFANSRFWLDEKAVEQTCLTGNQIREYANGKESVYGWHISALQIYDKPRELGEFFRCCTEKDDCHKCIHWDSSYDNTYYEPPDPPFEGCRTGEKKYFTRPPQSWAYVEELEEPCKTKN